MNLKFCTGTIFIISLTFTAGLQCNEPDNLADILKQSVQEVYLNPSFMRTRDFLPPRGLDIRRGRRTDSRSTTLRLENKNCSTMLSVDGTKQEFGLNEISTCPWTESLNIDPDRIPQTILEAECSCDQCVQYDGECSRSRRRPCYSYKGRCEKVMSSKVVVRRHCNQISGLYEYTSGLLPVAVGCTCSRDLVVHNKLAKSKRKKIPVKGNIRNNRG